MRENLTSVDFAVTEDYASLYYDALAYISTLFFQIKIE